MAKKKFLLGILMILLVLGMTACRRGPRVADLQGHWDGGPDGSFTFTGNHFTYASFGRWQGEIRGTFTISGDRITFIPTSTITRRNRWPYVSEPGYRFTISQNGRMLTIFLSESEFNTYHTW